MSAGAPRTDDLLLRMEALLRDWRPDSLVPAPVHADIPLLTEALSDDDERTPGDFPPVPAGITTEVLQAHLAVAAEHVMHELYRTLSTEINERLGEQLRAGIQAAVDHSINRTLLGLRRQLLVSVAESLTRSIEHTGRSDATPTDPSPPLTRP